MLTTRFYGLDARPFHHDESLYSKHVWNLHTGKGYRFDPMMLGPFIFHAHQIPMILFGDTDIAMRALPAFTGILLIIILFFTRDVWGEKNALMAGVMYAVNPVFMYYQRYVRQDIYFSLLSFISLIFLVKWLQTKRVTFFYCFAGFLSLTAATKFEAYWFFFIFTSFAGLIYLTGKRVRTGMTSSKISSVKSIWLNYPLVTEMVFVAIYWLTVFSGFAYLHTMRNSYRSLYRFTDIYWFASFFLYFSLLIVSLSLAWKQSKSKADSSRSSDVNVDNKAILLKSSVIYLLTGALFYTTWFTHLEGWKGMVYQWYEYWSHQHAVSRCYSPESTHNQLLLIYAILPVSIVLTGILSHLVKTLRLKGSALFFVISGLLVYAVNQSEFRIWMNDNGIMINLKNVISIIIMTMASVVTIKYIQLSQYLKAFLVWWTALTYFFYSVMVLQVVPWFLVNITFPAVLTASFFLQEFFQAHPQGHRKKVAIFFVVLLAIYELHTSFKACFISQGDASELLNYVHTSPDILRIRDEILNIRPFTVAETGKKILISGNASWPLTYYLRNNNFVEYGSVADSTKHLIVICDYDNRDHFNEMLGGTFEIRDACLREWWQPSFSDLRRAGLFKAAWRWLIHREIFLGYELYGCQKISVFTHRDLIEELDTTTSIGISAMEMIRVIESNIPGTHHVKFSEIPVSQICGHYTNGPGTSGNELLLFPNKTYINLEWADVLDTHIRDDGTWIVHDWFIELISDGNPHVYQWTIDRKRQKMLMFRYDTQDVEERFRLMSDQDYPAFEYDIRHENRTDKIFSFQFRTVEKIGTEPDWHQIARELLFWNEPITDDPDEEYSRGVVYKQKIGSIPPDITWETFREMLYEQYRYQVIEKMEHLKWLMTQEMCTPISESVD